MAVRGSIPGTVNICVIADQTDTEQLANDLSSFLVARDLSVIQCSPDYNDRFDPKRRKFHIVAIPQEAKEVSE